MKRNKNCGLGQIAIAGVCLLVLFNRSASGDTDLGELRISGELETGGRVVSGDFSSAPYEKYRELRPGLFGGGHFLLDRPDGLFYLRGEAIDVGERDELYRVELGRWGTGRLELDYGELRQPYSINARSPYRAGSDGVLTLPSGFASTIQGLGGNAAKSAGLAAALASAPSTSLEFRQRSGGARLLFKPLLGIEFDTRYRLQDKTGTQPFSMGFGSPGGGFANFAAPKDERIHDVRSALRIVRDAWNLEFGYNGNFFRNDLDSITIDNPLIATDSATASSRGRMATAPDNASHVFSVSGSSSLDFLNLDFPTQLTGSISYGLRTQDQSFLPHTINTAVASALLNLPEDSLEGDVRTFVGNFQLTARPLPRLNLKLRHKVYDYDNHTDTLVLPGHSVNDGALVSSARSSTANEYRRNQTFLDASYRVNKVAKLMAGYEWEQWDRSSDREVRELDEHKLKLGINLNPVRWAQMRMKYDVGIRRGSPYRPFHHLAHAVLETDTAAAQLQSQLVDLRKFDEADRIRNHFDVLAVLLPCEDVSVNLLGSYTRSNYDDSLYGLQDDERWDVGSDVVFRPHERVEIATNYSFESIRLQQKSRWRPRNFATPVVVIDDFVNDWLSRSRDRIHNAGLSVDVVLIPERLDARFGYEIQFAKASTDTRGDSRIAAAPPPTSSGDGGSPFDYPDIENILQTLLSEVSYHVKENLTLKAQYRFERYDLTNFRFDDLDPYEGSSNIDGSGTIGSSLDVFLGNEIEDYNAHILALSVILEF